MKAFILAAGLGTRLKPWTLEHPKALVPVGGVPMLERVILRLKGEGFEEITVNVHHFADQIVDFLSNHDFGVKINVSDESDALLDTGGGILKAAPLLTADEKPFLVHNVDILSDAPLSDLMARHIESGRDISLVTSKRESSRQLLFDSSSSLSGWHNVRTGQYRPEGFEPDESVHENAFSGIYIVNPGVLKDLYDYRCEIRSGTFPIMDYFLSRIRKINIGEMKLESLRLIDIGKPDTLSEAQAFFKNDSNIVNQW